MRSWVFGSVLGFIYQERLVSFGDVNQLARSVTINKHNPFLILHKNFKSGKTASGQTDLDLCGHALLEIIVFIELANSSP